MQNRTLAASLAGALLLAAAGIAATVQVFRRVSADRWVEHTREVQTLADKLLTNPIDAETGVRGYVLTGKEAFLEPYMASIQVVFTNIASLKAMTAGNSPQQKFLESIQRRVHLRILELEKIASFVKRGEQSKAVEAVQSEYGESVMQTVRGQIAKFGGRKSASSKCGNENQGYFGRQRLLEEAVMQCAPAAGASSPRQLKLHSLS